MLPMAVARSSSGTLKNTSKHTCSDAVNLKPPAPMYPLQDFKALYKYYIIIIIDDRPHRLSPGSGWRPHW